MCRSIVNSFLMKVALPCATAFVVLVAGCGTRQTETSVPSPNPTAQVQAELPPQSYPDKTYGIRVNGTEVNPTFGYVAPNGDTITCCTDLATADSLGRIAWRMRDR